MVDGAYQLIAEQLKPGVRENELVAEVTKALFDMGSEHVDDINAVSGERCSPHPHVFSDRLIRPGDQAFFDIIQTYVGYKTCYYRTFVVGTASDAQRDAYKQAREWIDASIELMQPGRDARTRSRSVWPRAEEFGFDSEMECFGLQFGHGVGLFLHERPIISRLNSLDHPIELKEGMVIALETYCPAKDGVLGRAHRGGGRHHRRRAADHHALPVGRAVRRQRRTDHGDRAGSGAERRHPTSTATIRLAHVPDHGRVPHFETARAGALLRGAGPGHDPPGRRPGGGRGRVRRGDARRRLHVRHVPRPQPRAVARRVDGRPARASCSAAGPG